jgi:hypothetical protein
MFRPRFFVGFIVLLGVGATLAQPRPRDLIPAGGVNVFYAATEPHIQAEIKVSDEQKKQLDEVARTYQAAVRAAAEAAPEELQAALDEANAGLKKALNADQIKRLRQIVTQRAVHQSGMVAYFQGGAGKALLAPNADQEKRFEAAAATTTAALKKAILADESADKITSLVATIRQEHEKKLLDALTPAQQTKWKEAVGVAFKDTPVRQPVGPGFFPEMGTLIPRTYPLVSEPVIQKALKLTDDQVKKLPERPPTKASLTGVLTAEQMTRLEQLTFQQGAQTAGQPYLLRYTVVTETLALTDEQKKDVEPLFHNAQNNALTTLLNRRWNYTAAQAKADAEALAKILTPAQQGKLKALLGEPFEGILPALRPFGPGLNPAPTTLAYLLEVDIQKDLVLVADQVAKAKDTQEALTARIRELGGPAAGLTPAERAAKRAEAQKAAEDALLAMLREPQKARLEQLRLQQRISQTSRGSVYREPKVAEALKLTADDLARIDKIEAGQRQVEQLILTEVPPILGGPRNQTNPAVQELTTAYQEKIKSQQDGLLTPEQKTRWETLIGKPYEGRFPVLFGPGGGPGGPGGFGGAGGGVIPPEDR